MNKENFYVYMLTNPQRKMLYTGVTNNLALRIIQHWKSRGMSQTFTGRYFCYNLIYFEEIKGWRREKKEELINSKNPSWEILNEKVCGSWPPLKYQIPPSSES